jgi:Bacterial inner membrane protein.
MLFGISYVEWFGYAASTIVAVSLTMSSIVKLRWFNLAGSALFATYGFVIGALPVALLNLFIVIVNIWYLVKMYRERDDFRIMRLSEDDEYLEYFLDCHRQDIGKFFPRFDFARKENRLAFYLVKNSVPIGLLIGTKREGGEFMIELDYVGPQYRDFKMGSYVYANSAFFAGQGIKTLVTAITGSKHDDYLAKMKFVRDGDVFRKPV